MGYFIESINRLRDEVPLPYKLADGLSTGAMLIASIWTARDLMLEVTLMLHWVASFVFHVFPSPINLLMDFFFIQAITHARLSRINPWIAIASRAAFVVGMNGDDIESIHAQSVMFVGIAHVAVFVCQWVEHGAWPFDYACLVFMSAVMYALSDMFLRVRHYAYKTLSTCAFHASLGVTQSIETRFYKTDYDVSTELFILFATITVMAYKATKLISVSSHPVSQKHVQ